MKKILTFLTLMFVLGNYAASAWTSDDDYVPLAREGNEWAYRSFFNMNEPMSFDLSPEKNFIYHIHGDTILNGIHYKKLYYKRCSSSFDNSTGTRQETVELDTCVIALRDEGKKVYAVNLNVDASQLGCSSFVPYLHGVHWETNREGVLYDFENVYDFMRDKYLAMFGDDDYHQSTFDRLVSAQEMTTDRIKVEGRKSIHIYDGVERGIFVEGIGICPPYRDADLLFFSVRTQYSGHPGGELMYMRNGDGIYEYLAEALETTAVETMNADKYKPEVSLHERQLTVTLPDISGQSVVELASIDGKRILSVPAIMSQNQIPLFDLPAGIYVVRVSTKLSNHSTKIILR